MWKQNLNAYKILFLLEPVICSIVKANCLEIPLKNKKIFRDKVWNLKSSKKAFRKQILRQLSIITGFALFTLNNKEFCKKIPRHAFLMRFFNAYSETLCLPFAEATVHRCS